MSNLNNEITTQVMKLNYNFAWIITLHLWQIKTFNEDQLVYLDQFRTKIEEELKRTIDDYERERNELFGEELARMIEEKINKEREKGKMKILIRFISDCLL